MTDHFLNCLNKPTNNLVTGLLEQTLTHEVVVPGALCWHHEKAKEAVRQQHLHFLVVRGQVAVRVITGIFVLSSPVVSGRS